MSIYPFRAVRRLELVLADSAVPDSAALKRIDCSTQRRTQPQPRRRQDRDVVAAAVLLVVLGGVVSLLSYY